MIIVWGKSLTNIVIKKPLYIWFNRKGQEKAYSILPGNTKSIYLLGITTYSTSWMLTSAINYPSPTESGEMTSPVETKKKDLCWTLTLHYKTYRSNIRHWTIKDLVSMVIHRALIMTWQCKFPLEIEKNYYLKMLIELANKCPAWWGLFQQKN